MKFTSATLIAAAQAGVMELIATTNMNGDVPFCIGCANAELGQFPWQLSLQTTGHFCGASILSPTALATAAHCRKSTYYAVAGTIDNRAGQKIQTNVFIGHPSYNGQKNYQGLRRRSGINSIHHQRECQAHSIYQLHSSSTRMPS